MITAPERRFHVAPWGDDSSPGTIENPFRTLLRAQEGVRACTADMQGDVVVELHPGIHVLTEPLRLSAAAGDSGENGHRVIYQAHGWGDRTRESVVVSGGQRIDGWQLDDEAKNIWRADAGDVQTRQLYVDGVRAVRARLGAGQHALPGEVTRTVDGYMTDSLDPQSWENPNDIEFIYRGHSGFAEPRCGVAAISGDQTQTTIRMQQPGYRWYSQNHTGLWGDEPERGFGHKLRFEPPLPIAIENSRSFLTEPGTFYLDRSHSGARLIYYIPRPGEDLSTADVIAPMLEHLVDGSGTPEVPLHDVTIRGLTFAHATWMGPSEPTAFSQVFGPVYEGGDTADFDDPWDSSNSAKSMPGNLRFRHSERIVIEGNCFTQLGADALELSLGASECVVRGNVFTDLSGGGIQLGSRQPDTKLDRTNPENTIENNLVYGFGLEYSGSIGIYAEKIQKARIAHNQVNDGPYIGIAFGEYWTHYPEGETTAWGNRILDNHIFSVMQRLRDGGAIFTAAHQGTSYENGTVVSGNLVHDIASLTARDHGQALELPDIDADNANHDIVGLYADDDSNFVTWTENIVYGVDGVVIQGCPLNNTFVLNFLEDTAEPTFWCSRGGRDVVFRDNIVLDSRNDPAQQLASSPSGAAILARAGLEPAYRHLLPSDTSAVRKTEDPDPREADASPAERR